MPDGASWKLALPNASARENANIAGVRAFLLSDEEQPSAPERWGGLLNLAGMKEDRILRICRMARILAFACAMG
jgi:hypothetical protein